MKSVNHAKLAAKGVVIPLVRGFLEKDEMAMDYSMAMDAQPGLVTTVSGGVPAFLLNYVDPDVINILFTPNNATKIAGEVKKGDWTTQTAMFPIAETTGEVSSYGDFNENGNIKANVNWVNRQSYLFQTMTRWGERELEIAAEARIDYAQKLNRSSAIIMDKFQNNSYFYGISGLENYGLLNDPSLIASIAPGTKAKGGTTWGAGDGAEIYADVQALYEQLVSQTQGLVTREDAMVLSLSPTSEANLTKTNTYNVNVTDQIKKNFPNMRIEVAVQYSTDAGELVQLAAETIEGEEVRYCAFNEKMRAHPVIVKSSSYLQKKTGGTWGAIIRMPMAIAGMIGI